MGALESTAITRAVIAGCAVLVAEASFAALVKLLVVDKVRAVLARDADGPRTRKAGGRR